MLFAKQKFVEGFRNIDFDIKIIPIWMKSSAVYENYMYAFPIGLIVFFFIYNLIEIMWSVELYYIQFPEKIYKIYLLK